MKRHLCPLLLAVGLPLAATPLLAGEAPPAPAAAKPAAEAGHCVSLARIRQTRVLDDRTILFELTGNETLVNHLPYRCPGLGFDKSFGYKTSLSELCSQDIIWVITNTPGMQRGASCGLGKFEPYVAPESVDAAKDKGKLEAQ